MTSENKKSDAEEVLEEFQKTHEVENPEVEHSKQEPQQEPQQNNSEQKSVESNQTTRSENMIFIGTKPIMTYVTATLTQLASLPMVTISARGKRITQAIDVSQMIVKRMDEVGFVINDVRTSSDSLTSEDGRVRNVSNIEIDIKKVLDN